MRRTITALCVGTLLIGVAGCSDDDNGVRLGTVGRSTVTEVVEAPATVTAKATAEVTSAADGRISELRVREGQAVRAGRILLRIGSPRALRQLRDARRADAEAASAGNVAVPSGGLTSAQLRADAEARAAFAAARRSARQIADRQVRAQALAAVRASEAQYAAARAQAQDAVRQFNAGLGSLSNAIGSLAVRAARADPGRRGSRAAHRGRADDPGAHRRPGVADHRRPGLGHRRLPAPPCSTSCPTASAGRPATCSAAVAAPR